MTKSARAPQVLWTARMKMVTRKTKTRGTAGGVWRPIAHDIKLPDAPPRARGLASTSPPPGRTSFGEAQARFGAE